jgi:hypothetical protein
MEESLQYTYPQFDMIYLNVVSQNFAAGIDKKIRKMYFRTGVSDRNMRQAPNTVEKNSLCDNLLWLVLDENYDKTKNMYIRKEEEISLTTHTQSTKENTYKN